MTYRTCHSSTVNIYQAKATVQMDTEFCPHIENIWETSIMPPLLTHIRYCTSCPITLSETTMHQCIYHDKIHVHLMLFRHIWKYLLSTKQWHHRHERLLLSTTFVNTFLGHWVEDKQNNWCTAANLRPQGRLVLTWRLPVVREISSILLFYPVPEHRVKKYCLF